MPLSKKLETHLPFVGSDKEELAGELAISTGVLSAVVQHLVETLDVVLLWIATLSTDTRVRDMMMDAEQE